MLGRCWGYGVRGKTLGIFKRTYFPNLNFNYNKINW